MCLENYWGREAQPECRSRTNYRHCSQLRGCEGSSAGSGAADEGAGPSLLPIPAPADYPFFQRGCRHPNALGGTNSGRRGARWVMEPRGEGRFGGYSRNGTPAAPPLLMNPSLGSLDRQGGGVATRLAVQGTRELAARLGRAAG